MITKGYIQQLLSETKTQENDFDEDVKELVYGALDKYSSQTLYFDCLKD
jgi:hypothetical protein